MRIYCWFGLNSGSSTCNKMYWFYYCSFLKGNSDNRIALNWMYGMTKGYAWGKIKQLSFLRIDTLLLTSCSFLILGKNLLSLCLESAQNSTWTPNYQLTKRYLCPIRPMVYRSETNKIWPIFNMDKVQIFQRIILISRKLQFIYLSTHYMCGFMFKNCLRNVYEFRLNAFVFHRPIIKIPLNS